ncbi:hypothetical protein Droror1_Dr00025981 [Drosera rotundifolia]
MSDLNSLKCIRPWKGGPVMAMSCDPSGGYVATARADKKVLVWDVGHGRCTHCFKGHKGVVTYIMFHPDPSRLLLSSASDDGTIRVWDLHKNSKEVTGSALSEDGGISLSAGSVKRFLGYNEEVLDLKFLDDDENSLAVATNAEQVWVYDLSSMSYSYVLAGHTEIIICLDAGRCSNGSTHRYRQQGQRSSGDRTVKLWSIADGSCLKTFEGHNSGVLRVSFISHGNQFVSCGADGLVKLWTVQTDECNSFMIQDSFHVYSRQMVMYRCGHWQLERLTEKLATGGSDACINIWHDHTAADKEEAFHKEEESILKVQELENAMSDGDYTKAIQIAFDLRRSHKLFEVLSETCRTNKSKDHQRIWLATIGIEELRWLFEYIRKWNTQEKLNLVAQLVLFQIFSLISPTKISEVSGIRELLEVIRSYTV